MRRRNGMTAISVIAAGIAFLFAGCTGVFPAESRNPFLTLAETFGVPFDNDNGGGGGGGGGVVTGEFRRTMSITFANNSRNWELNTAFVAWVNVSSIRNADQQDSLLRGGYVQVTNELRLGTSVTLPPGTFVFNGPGVAGATTVRLNEATGDANNNVPSTLSVNLITPDAFLVFYEPPVSCDSVAFFFTTEGEVPTALSPPGKGAVILFSGSAGLGFLKTLAQIEGYQCSPLKPGYFLKLGGGARKANEFFEGENLRFDFGDAPDANGNFAVVTIS